MTPCGSVKHVDGGTTLVCGLPADGHTVHAVLYYGRVLARWPVPFTADDVARLADRYTWSKPHVRREYQTSAMWKARQ